MVKGCSGSGHQYSRASAACVRAGGGGERGRWPYFGGWEVRSASTDSLGNVGAGGWAGRRARGGAQIVRYCWGALQSEWQKQDVRRLPEGYRSTFIPLGRGPVVSFLTLPIDFFENEAKQVESGMALGLRTGCDNMLKD